jgi:sec-independent protein translocase protein TatA
VQLGPAEILVVLVIALLVFGPKKLPEVGRQVGRAMKEFRQFQHMMSRDFAEVFDDSSASAEPAPTLPPKASTIDVSSTSVPSGDAAPVEAPSAANDTGAPPDPEADA